MNSPRVRFARLRTSTDDQGGFTLVELLVAMSLFLVLSGIVLSAIITLSRGLDEARVTSEVSAEARMALERIAREVRQAKELESPLGNSVTVNVDFNRDGSIGGPFADPSDPEIVTYAHNASTKSIEMTARNGGVTPPVELLAGQVSSMSFIYTSSNWKLDANHDGTVTLAEAGADGPDQVEISLVVGDEPGVDCAATPTQCSNFKSHVTLRNRSQS